MKNKFFKILNLLIIVLLVFSIKIFAKSKYTIDIDSNKYEVKENEEFEISINSNNIDLAAFTLWIYFDNEKVECISNENNINILDNRVIYTWFSDTGENKEISEILNLKFKSEQEGVASFSLIGEFYNENGNAIDVEFTNTNVSIGDVMVNSNETDNEDIEENASEENISVNENNADLDVLRLGLEGISPDFNSDILEYYLVVDDDIDKIDVTAIPKNMNAKVEITGNTNLKNGLNKIEITVTSEDKLNKNKYIVNVTKTRNAENANANLETLAIENYTLVPEFNNNATNYNVQVSSDEEKLNILAIPSNMEAKVQIDGNDKLKQGNNKVTITITAKDNITKKEYVIDVYKRNREEENTFVEEEKKQIEETKQVIEKINNENVISTDRKNENNENRLNEEDVDSQSDSLLDKSFIIFISMVIILIVGIVVISIKKYRKMKK